MLGLQRFVTAYAGIVLPNEASVAFHRSMGFDPFCTYETVGHKHGAWRDVQWYQRRLGELPAEPAPPAPITEVRSRESWDEAVSVGRSSIEL